MDWDKLVDLLVSGVTLGSVYALVALGFSLVYGILKLLNLAHGDVVMVGAFLGWGILGWLGGAEGPNVAVWLLISLMMLGAMIGCGFLGVAIERFAYRPLRRAPRIAPLISALGVSFFLQNTVLLLYGADFRSYDTDFLVDVDVGIDWGPLTVWLIRIVVVVSAFAMMLGLWLLVTRTRFGKAMRATAFDREAAEMMGIDVDRVDRHDLLHRVGARGRGRECSSGSSSSRSTASWGSATASRASRRQSSAASARSRARWSAGC